MKKRYTHIFFDLDNTLWDFEKNSRVAMQSTFNHFIFDSFKIDFNTFLKVYSKHNDALWMNYRKKEMGKKELVRRRFQDTLSELKICGVDPEQMNIFYLNEMPKQKLLYPGVLEILEYLKNKHYQLFIITNGFTEVQHRKIESSGLKTFFKKVFTSEEVKTPKPGREIFEYAVKSVNAKKINSLMIGDDWEVDVRGAIDFGIDAVYFANKKNIEFEVLPGSIEANTKIFRIGSVNQLYSIL